VADETPPMRLVLTYIEAAQRARASGDADDFEALREFLAAGLVIMAASPWTDEPWQVMHRGADALITRLQAPINKATSLTTENVNVQQAGNDVLVEQLSTLFTGDRTHVLERTYSTVRSVRPRLRRTTVDGWPPATGSRQRTAESTPSEVVDA